MNGQRACTLHHATGVIDSCPGAYCPFWDANGTVSAGCVFESLGLDLEGRPDIARWLLGVRADLEEARTNEERAEVQRSSQAHLPPGLRL